MKKIFFTFLFLLSSLIYAGPLTVVASFSILGDIVKNIGGDKINVITMVGPNQDSHEYQIKPSDLTKINHSQIFFINGLGLEGGWINQLVKSYRGKVVVVTNGIKPLYSTEKHLNKTDPHAWNDVQNVRDFYVPNILNGLIAIDPQNRAYYEKNAKIYTKELSELNKWVIDKINQVPKENRDAITTHDAFGYFAWAYRVNFISVQGISTDSEASAKDVVNLELIIKKSKVKVVFLENMTNNKLINQIAKDTGAVIGGHLYSDALSEPTKPANTYINMIKFNTNTLMKAWGTK